MAKKLSRHAVRKLKPQFKKARVKYHLEFNVLTDDDEFLVVAGRIIKGFTTGGKERLEVYQAEPPEKLEKVLQQILSELLKIN